MAKFYRNGTAIGLRRTMAEEAEFPLPESATDLVEFDETVPANSVLISEFSASSNRFSFASGVLLKDGSPVSFAAESSERTTKRELKGQIQTRLDEIQAIINGVDSSNNTQLRTAVKVLARNQRRIILLLARLV